MARRRGLVYGELKKGDTSKIAVSGGEGFLPELITQGFGDWGEPSSIILDGFIITVAGAGLFPEIIAQGFGMWSTRHAVILDGLFHYVAPLPAGTGIAAPLIQGADLFEDSPQGLFF